MTYIPQHVSTLLSAIRFDDGLNDDLAKLTDAQWQDLLLYCDMSHLTIPVGLRLKRNVPEWVQERIERNIADNTARFERIKLVYREISEEFSRLGMEHLVLKGFAQWPAHMQHPRFRAQSDIDLFCPPESCATAMGALMGLGYSLDPFQKPSDQHLPTMLRAGNYRWRGNFYDPEMPLSIEVHSRFWNSNTTHIELENLEEFWDRRIWAQVDEASFPAMSLTDAVGYAALHIFRHLQYTHLMSGQLYEIAWFLHTTACDAEFWASWKQTHGKRLRTIEAVSFRLAKHCFACELPSHVQEEVEALDPTVLHWIGKCAESAMYTLIRPNKDFVFLHLSLLESSTARRAIFCRNILWNHLPAIGRFANPDSPRGLLRTAIPKYYRYSRHVLARLTYHGKQLPRLLINGLRWWWSTKELGKQFWTFYAASFCFDLGMFIFFFLFNLYLLDAGFDIKFLGMVTSSMAAGNIAGTLPAAWLAQRFGLRKTLLLCFTAIALSLGSRAVFVAPLAQLCLAFLGGMGSSIWAVCISPALAQLTTERNRAFGFSLVFSFGIGEGALGGLIGGNLPGWLQRITPIASPAEAKKIALLIAGGVVAIGLLPLSRLSFSDVGTLGRKIYSKQPFLTRFLIAMGLWSLVTGAFSPFFNAFFSKHLEVPLGKLGTISAAAQLSQVAAILAAPYIFKRFGLVSGIVYMQMATALSLVGVAVASNASTAAAAYVAYMAFLWMSEPGMYGLLMNKVLPTERNGASSLNFLVISVAQMIAAIIAGFSFDRYGYPLVLYMIALVAGISAGCFRLLITEDRPSLAGTSTSVLEAGSE